MSINNIFKEITVDIEKSCKKAVEDAAQRALDKVNRTAFNCLNRYYANYIPNYYERTGTLRGMIKPIQKPIPIDNGYLIKIEYNTDNLFSMYYSRSRYHKSGGSWKVVPDNGGASGNSDYGIPEVNWILDNYMYGRHPSGKWSHAENYTPWAQIDSNPTKKVMDKLFEKELPLYVHRFIKSALKKG